MQASEKPKQKSYRQGSSLYFSAGLVLSLVLVVTAFEWKTPYLVFDGGPIDISTTDGPPIDLIVKPSPRPPQPKGTEIVAVPEPTAAIKPDDLTPPVIDEPIGPDFDDNSPLMIGGAAPGGDETAPVADFSKAAVPADGYEAFYAYLYKNLSIPDHIVRQGIGGKVQVAFTVDTDGRLTDIQIVRGFDKQIEQQIIKVLEGSSAWEPAWQHGSKVRMRMQLPVVIQINR